MSHTISLNVPTERYLRSIVDFSRTESPSVQVNNVFAVEGYRAGICFEAAKFQHLAVYKGLSPEAWIEISCDAHRVEPAARYALLFGMDMWDSQIGRIAAVFDFSAVVFALDNRSIAVTHTWSGILSVMLRGREWTLLEDQ